MARRNAKLSSLSKGGEERSPITFESNGLAGAPKHVSLPHLPPESELSFESQTILLFLISMLTQYLNLYRTVWWLSSHGNNMGIGRSWWSPTALPLMILNFHLIDMNVVHFNVVFVTRSFLQHVAMALLPQAPSSSSRDNSTDGDATTPTTSGSGVRGVIAIVVNSAIIGVCAWMQTKCVYYIYLNHGVTGILCIAYPFIIYVLMYFPNLVQSYERCRRSSSSSSHSAATAAAVAQQSVDDNGSPMTSTTTTSSSGSNNNWWQWSAVGQVMGKAVLPSSFSHSPPVHCCSSNTSAIRDEVDRLKSSFNERLKFILFRSLVVAYFSSFVPLCLVQPQLHYDVTWTAQHVAICWLSSFLLLTSHLYSPHFYDVLHKSSLHLGKWQRLETRNTLVPCTQWADRFLYAQGVVVKHAREYFKAEGVANCAEPGNQSHLRFYVVFSNPIGGFGTLLGLLVTLIAAQLFLLIRSFEWYKVISMSCMIVVNSITIFRLVRSYYVLREVYKVEAHLQDTSSHLH